MSITLGFLQSDAERQLETVQGMMETLSRIRQLAEATQDVRQKQDLTELADRLAHDANRLVKNASEVGRAIGELTRGFAA